MAKGCSKERAFEILIDDAKDRLSLSVQVFKVKHYDLAVEDIKKVLNSLYAAKRVAVRALRRNSQPVRAFGVYVHGFPDGIVPTKTASKARWIAVKSMQDVGYTESGQFKNVRVARIPKYDTWAQTAKEQCYCMADLPKV